ncbi:MAG TPA: hypothetical protein VMZ50_02385, partial [Phycisphaerae bacterium]|nr:hypothetical protein [Phycisphaerae bacterium]
VTAEHLLGKVKFVETKSAGADDKNAESQWGRWAWGDPVDGLQIGVMPGSSLGRYTADTRGPRNVRMRLALRNRSDRPIRVNLAPDDGCLSVVATTQDGRAVETRLVSMPNSVEGAEAVTIEPGREIRLGPEGLVDDETRLYLNVEPGQYRVRIAYAADRAKLWRGGIKTPEVTVTIPHRRTVSGEFVSSATLDTVDVLRNRLVSRLVGVPGDGRVLRGPVLIGYTSLCPIDPLPARQLERQGWSVVVWPLGYVAPAPGKRVRIPSGFVDVAFERPPGAPLLWDEGTEEFHPLTNEASLRVAARPPAPIGPLRDAAAELRIGIRATGFRLRVFGVDSSLPAGRAKTLLESFDSPVGVRTVRAADADRFRRSDGSYVFVLAAERLTETKPEDVLDASTWGRLESVDVELEGMHP